MDWNPTTTSSVPTSSAIWRATPPPPQPSFTTFTTQQRHATYNTPFTALPSLIPAPAAAPTARENFFSHRLNAPSSIPLGASFSKVAAPSYRLGSPLYPPMAPQRFFIPDEATGLESLMGGGLRLDDAAPAPSRGTPEEAWWCVGVRGALVVAAVAGLVLRGPAWAQPAVVVVVLRAGQPRWVLAQAAGVAAALYIGWVLVAAAVVGVVGALEVAGVAARLRRGWAREEYEREKKEREEVERREREGSEGSIGASAGRRSRAGSAGLGFGAGM